MKTLQRMLQQVHRLAAVQTSRGLSDGELLERFIGEKDEAAFTVLVERHGPLVLGVCRRALGNLHDAEDACQASFLVLARKATSIRKTASVSSWLHRVASSIARNMKRERCRRQRRERDVRLPVGQDPAADVGWREMLGALDEELEQLPERYRAPLILCYLDGRTRDDAAVQLGITPGTLHGRLERGRRLLCDRLTRRGLTLSGTLMAAAVGEGVAHAALSPTLVLSVTEASALFASGKPVGGSIVSAHVLSLTREALRTMLLSKLKLAAVTVLCVGLLLGAAAGMLNRAGVIHDSERESNPHVAAAESAEPTVDAAAEDAKKLEGEWRAVGFESNGERNPSYVVRSQRQTMNFKGDEFIVKNEGGNMVRMKFNLDPTKSPKTIDIVWGQGLKVQTMAGIYALIDGQLWLCHAPPSKDSSNRPTGFKTRPGDKWALTVLERVKPIGSGNGSGLGERPADKAADELGAVLRDWKQANNDFWDAHSKVKTAGERRKVEAEKTPKPEPFAERCVNLAEAYPDTEAGLAALCLAAHIASKTEAGKKALTILQGGLIARADPEELMGALDAARTTYGEQPKQLAPSVLARGKQVFDHPRAPRLLTWVCTCYMHDAYMHDASPEPPPTFTEAADLVVSRFAGDPDVIWLCECLGGRGGRCPPWAGKFEKHLRTILKTNHHFRARCTAQIALASVLQQNGQEGDAQKLYDQFVKEYGGGAPNDQWNVVLTQLLSHAKRQIEEIRVRGIGRPAPEIEGEDLDGKPMRLSDYRGKVVLLDFWGFW